MLESPARTKTLTGRSAAPAACFALLLRAAGLVVGAAGASFLVDVTLGSDVSLGSARPARPVQLVTRVTSCAASTAPPMSITAAPTSSGQRSLERAGRCFGC